MSYSIALFAEAEMGKYGHLYHFDSLITFAETLGNPPPESQGMTLGIQALLFEKRLYFIRVEEEGLSTHDYLNGLKLLKKSSLIALCIPGTSDQKILTASAHFCDEKQLFLLTSEKDFYDFVTTHPM